MLYYYSEIVSNNLKICCIKYYSGGVASGIIRYFRVITIVLNEFELCKYNLFITWLTILPLTWSISLAMSAGDLAQPMYKPCAASDSPSDVASSPSLSTCTFSWFLPALIASALSAGLRRAWPTALTA